MSSAEMASVDELLQLNISIMNKPQLLIKTKELQDALKRERSSSNIDYVLKRLEVLEKRQNESEAEIRQLHMENKKLLKKIRNYEDDLNDAEERFIDLERSINNIDQYVRRENF